MLGAKLTSLHLLSCTGRARLLPLLLMTGVLSPDKQAMQAGLSMMEGQQQQDSSSC